MNVGLFPIMSLFYGCHGLVYKMLYFFSHFFLPTGRAGKKRKRKSLLWFGWVWFDLVSLSGFSLLRCLYLYYCQMDGIHSYVRCAWYSCMLLCSVAGTGHRHMNLEWAGKKPEIISLRLLLCAHTKIKHKLLSSNSHKSHLPRFRLRMRFVPRFAR